PNDAAAIGASGGRDLRGRERQSGAAVIWKRLLRRIVAPPRGMGGQNLNAAGAPFRKDSPLRPGEKKIGGPERLHLFPGRPGSRTGSDIPSPGKAGPDAIVTAAAGWGRGPDGCGESRYVGPELCGVWGAGIAGRSDLVQSVFATSGARLDGDPFPIAGPRR